MQGHDTLATLIGFTGVGLLLLAFVLNLANFLKAESVPYLALNLIGAGLACASSWMIDFMPFVILEGTWAVATLIALIRVVAGQATQPS
jgi:glucose-6-phosphate-specific signal transduction histidine kinase